MDKNFLFTFVFIFSFGVSYSQNWDARTGIIFQPNLDGTPTTSLNGIYFSSHYSFKEYKRFKLMGGLEFQGNSWANHLLINIGLTYNLVQKENWTFETELTLGNGLAAFQPAPLYSHSSKMLFIANYITKKQNCWGVGVGPQFITTPSYKNFSTNFNAWNLPLVVRFGF